MKNKLSLWFQKKGDTENMYGSCREPHRPRQQQGHKQTLKKHKSRKVE